MVEITCMVNSMFPNNYTTFLGNSSKLKQKKTQKFQSMSEQQDVIDTMQYHTDMIFHFPFFDGKAQLI